MTQTAADATRNGQAATLSGQGPRGSPPRPQGPRGASWLRPGTGAVPGSKARLAALAGVVAPLAFYTVMIVLGQVTPGYNAMTRFGSELSFGSLGWIMIANFLVLGLVEIAFAARLHRAIGSHRSGRLGAVMVGVVGAALLVAGIFVTDPAGTLVSFHGALHFGAALVLFCVALPTAGLALAYRFRDRRGFALSSAVVGAGTPLLFIATFVSGEPVGLMERILIGLDFLWLAILSLLVFRGRLGDLYAGDAS
jgi:Protein of unknown function (DUF998)